MGDGYKDASGQWISGTPPNEMERLHREIKARDGYKKPEPAAPSIQSKIREWHEATFGDEYSHGRVVRTAKKTLEEAAEMYVAARGDDHGDNFFMEVADVAITCYAIAIINGVDLHQWIERVLADLWMRPNQKERDRERGI